MSLSYFGAATRHDAIEQTVENGPTMVVHDQDLSVGELRLSAQLRVSAAFGVAVELPLRRFATTIRYLDVFGDEVTLVAPDIHHRDQTLWGPGDPWLLATWQWQRGALALGARAGASLPLGETQPDPFALGDMGLPHEHFQFGTGTVDPVVGVEAEWRVGGAWGWRLGAFALTKQTVDENDRGYQAGDRYAGGLSAASGLGTRALDVRLGAEVQIERAERWNGVVPTDDGNQGRVDVLVGAGARWRVRPGLELEGTLRVPIVQEVVGGQIDMPAVVELGARWAFDAWGGGEGHHEDEDDHDHADDHDHDHADDHDHDHADDHDHAPADAPPAAPRPGVDVADVVTAGEVVELVPVPGVVTVFDFWAPWCEPCKELDDRLHSLAEKHPGRLAIRKVNIVDWDSPATARWLTPGGYNLPHLKVYGADGRLVLEKSTSPAALVGEVERILDGD